MSNKTVLNTALAASLLALGLGGTAIASEKHEKAAAPSSTTAAPYEHKDKAAHEKRGHKGKAESEDESKEHGKEADDDEREDADETKDHD